MKLRYNNKLTYKNNSQVTYFILLRWQRQLVFGQSSELLTQCVFNEKGCVDPKLQFYKTTMLLKFGHLSQRLSTVNFSKFSTFSKF